MKNRKVVWKALTALQEEYEAKWLAEMSAKGWHLIKYLPFIYIFEKGEPREYIYKFDYQTKLKDKDSYIQIFKDAGWEYILEYMGWQFFRCRPDNVNVPELFTDDESRIAKYLRLIRILGSVYIMIILISVGIVFNPHNDYSGRWPLKVIYSLMLFIYTYIIAGLYLRIREIKKRV